MQKEILFTEEIKTKLEDLLDKHAISNKGQSILLSGIKKDNVYEINKHYQIEEQNNIPDIIIYLRTCFKDSEKKDFLSSNLRNFDSKGKEVLYGVINYDQLALFQKVDHTLTPVDYTLNTPVVGKSL